MGQRKRKNCGNNHSKNNTNGGGCGGEQQKGNRCKNKNANQSRNDGSIPDNELFWNSTAKIGKVYDVTKKRHFESYIDKLKKGEKNLSNMRDAQQFFKILSKDYEEPTRLVLKFDGTMECILQRATNLLHPDLEQPMKLLAAMGEETLAHGVYKDRALGCFRAFYFAADFMLKLNEQLTTGRLNKPKDHSVVAWFILQLGKSGDEQILNDPLVADVIRFLKTSKQAGFPQLSNQLDIVFQHFDLNSQDQNTADTSRKNFDTEGLASLQEAQMIMRPPGTRDHDNDKENYRSISIVPTTSELQCNDVPYLPSAHGSDFIHNEEAFTLDRQFRLMREDLNGTVKEELKSELNLCHNQRRRFFLSPRIMNFGMKPEPHIVVRVSIPSRVQQRIKAMKNPEASKFFEEGAGKRVLQKGTLVILVYDASNKKSQSKIVERERNILISGVGTIVERLEPMKVVKIPGTDPVKRERVLEVGIQFTPETLRSITPLIQNLNDRNIGVPLMGSSGGLFNASAGIFSLEPILKALVRMDQVPMHDQLIYLNEPICPFLSYGNKRLLDLSPNLQKAVASDCSQKLALEQIFKSNTVLVQGPPGTGKTYIGVQMVKAMLEFEHHSPMKDRPLRILCLCYTNHALDSFLLDLINAGVPKEHFIRLGYSPKIDPKIKSRCLGEVGKSNFTKVQNAAFGAIKRESEELENRFKELLRNIAKNSTWGRSISWWNRIREWMEENYPEELEQLLISQMTDSSGFDITGKKGKSIKGNYLWVRWYQGNDKGVFRDKTNGPTELWRLTKDERLFMINDWNREWLQPQLDLLESTMKSLQKNAEALRRLRQINDLRVLKNAKIVGCTTVSAARYEGMINPTVVIVEEAGEILESHVLANLGSSCQQLIMIGDHKQLRPKIDNYRLQKESGNGFDLNESLFERLVTAPKSKIPVIPLTVQHRMRPEISNIIRGMALYEDLQDHMNTKQRNHVSGVAGDVVFIDHRHPEQQDEATAAVGMETKVNPYEAEMVVNITRYIIQQGQYSTDQVTILTPYLGQLSLIRKKLASIDIGSLVSDQDINELSRHDLDTHSNQANKQIRVATVDNFQGEESEIIVVSLVRSNPKNGSIGFLASEERVNVLFSRAREGMYIVGNLKSLTECSSRHGRELWSKVKTVFDSANNCRDFFPAECQRHHSLQKIISPEDFSKLTPEGGCSLQCPLILDCGHQCPKKCHGHIKHVHSMVKCRERVQDICANGHLQLRECGSTVICNKQMSWLCPRGHSIFGICKNGRPKTCKTCRMIEKLEDDARELEEKEEMDMLEQEQKLIQTKMELSMSMKRKETKSKIEAIQREQILAQRELLEMANQSSLNSDGEDVDIHKYHYVTDSESKNVIGMDKEKCIHDLPTDTEGLYLDEERNNSQNSVSCASKTTEGNVVSEKLSCQVSNTGDKPEDIVQSKKPIGIKSHMNTRTTSALLQDANFCDAMARFEAKEYLEADDLIENCLSTMDPSMCKVALEAFRFIIHHSLDHEEKWTGVDLQKADPVKSFEEAIECWASFLSISSSNEFPFLAKERAENFLAYNRMEKKTKSVLNIGRLQAQEVVRKAQQLKSKPGSYIKYEGKIDDEAIQKEWERIMKNDKDAPSVVYDQVLKMTGLRAVKRALIDQYNRIKIAQRQNDTAASSYNVRFEGNPGTGKTTIAGYYSKFLKQLTVLPEQSILIDETAASIMNKGISHLTKLLEKLKNCGGGVLFIDEAYQMRTDREGEKILDFILPISDALDGKYGKIVWIFAGYQKEMDKLFEHNAGLSSRFPQRFKFDDYSASEMASIFYGLMKYKDAPIADIETKKNSKPKLQSQAPYISRRRQKSAYESIDGDSFNDMFGNKWTCNVTRGLWIDEYKNSSGYHPENIGSLDNPLASPNGQIWTYEENLWKSKGGISQIHYPGSPYTTEKASSKRVARKPPFTCEDEKYIRIATRRLERQSNRPGFGNARAVRVLFDIVRERQATRLTNCKIEKDLFLFTKDDLLGAIKSEAELKKSKAYKKLLSLEGLKPVKEQIDLLIKLSISNVKREEMEKPPLDVLLNRVFLGNPGTGKTTVAKIYGQLLTEMGLLSKGEVIVKNPSDFRGDVLGSSEKNTRDILRAAEGNVLVIDEAYALCTNNSLNGSSDPYGTAVIDTLVEQIQARPGDDRAVVMLGYRKEMEQMFKNVNPGLSRRFQLDQAYEFPDYDDTSLLKILCSKVKESRLSIPIPVAKLAVRSLARARAKPNFGNGGAVDILLSRAKEQLQKRDQLSDTLIIEDFLSDDISLNEVTLDSLFENMIGMDGIINQLKELKSVVEFAKSRGENAAESVSFNYLFLGNPGTGKTTVARLMGTMFKKLGLLPDDKVFECTPKDLITGFVGQAGHKTSEILEQSRGGVLFIDEAYQLNPNRGGSFMTEAVDELCAKLTDEDFRGKQLVLLAGYDADMEEMLKFNPGLKSRFSERIMFSDLSEEATRDLIKLKLEKKKIPLDPDVAESEELLALSRQLVESPDFANGRDVGTVCNKTYAQLAMRSSNRNNKNTKLVDVKNAVTSLLLSRASQKNSKSCAGIVPVEQTNDQSESTSHPTIQLTAGKVECDEAKDEGNNKDEFKESQNITAEDENSFNRLEKDYIAKLQDIVEELNLNTEEGIEMIISSNDYDSYIIEQLMKTLMISREAAGDFLIDWREAHEKSKQQKIDTKTKFKGMEAIWHCAVCGRGGQPRPVCFVAPYISSYRPALI